MKYQKYEKYKDSGIGWIDIIPINWEVKKLKYFAKIYNGKDQKDIKDDLGKNPILGTGGVFGFTDSFLYDKESVLLGRKGTIDNPIYIDKPFWTVDTLFFTKIKKEVCPKFFFYACKTIPFDLFKYGSAVPSMTQEDLSNLSLTYPPIKQQQSIANFLDRETTRIDALIDKKQKLIDLLKEKRTALITKAVTKGLNPNVKMKDSGIEWLGEVPEHWKKIKLGHYSKWRSGNFISNENYKKENDDKFIFPVIGGNGIAGWSDKFMVDEELIIIGRVGALCGNVHYIYEKCWINDNALFSYWHKDFNLKFLAQYLNFIDINRFSSQTAQPLITGTIVSNLHLVLPPIKEQNEIVFYLEQETNKIDSLILKTEQSIEKQKEYRTALISTAVTGKIKVSGQ